MSRQLPATGALTAVVNVGVSRGAQALEAGDVVRVRVIADGDPQRTVSTTVTGDTLTDAAHTVSVDATSLLPATSLTVELSVVSGVIDTNANGAVAVRVDPVNVGINTPDAADTFTYDNAGRMVTRTVDGVMTTLTWDVLSNLVGTSGKGGTRLYLYDASGQRVAQVREASAGLSGPVPGTATVYVGGTEASDTDTGTPGVGVSATRYYTIGGATVATLHVENGVQTWSLMLGDTQGSAQVMVDLVVSGTASGFAPITSASTGVTRTAYMPYGSGRGTSQLSIDRGWLGQVQDDDTGLVYLNARYYDPVLGRFLSPDPLMNPGDPKTLDPYRYADNNPAVFTDATGLRPIGQYDCAGAGCNITNNGTVQTLAPKPKPKPVPTKPAKPTTGGILGQLTSGLTSITTAVSGAVDTIGSKVTDGVAAVNGLARDVRSAVAKSAEDLGNWTADKAKAAWHGTEAWWKEHGDKVLLVAGILVAVVCLGVTAGAGSIACMGAGLAVTGATIWDGKANRGMSNGQAIVVGVLGVVGSVGGPLAAAGMKSASLASAASGVTDVAQVTKLTVPEMRLANGIFGGPSLAVGAGEWFSSSNG